MRVIVFLLLLIFFSTGVSQTVNQIKVNPKDVSRVKTIKIKPHIKIRIPSMYSRLQKSQTLKIEWEKFGKMEDKVRIKLAFARYKKPLNIGIDAKGYLITEKTKNNGEFSCKIPPNVKLGKYRIIINTLDKKIKAVSQIFLIEKSLQKEE